MSNNTRTIVGRKDQVAEIATNLLSVVLGEENFELVETDDSAAVKWETTNVNIHPVQLKMVEALLYSREEQGLLNGLTLELMDEEVLEGSYYINCGEAEKCKSVFNDVFKTAGISEDKISMVVEPFATTLLSMPRYTICAVNLTQEEEECITRALGVKKLSLKVRKVTNTLQTTGLATMNMAMKDMMVPLGETAGKLGGSLAQGLGESVLKMAIVGAETMTTNAKNCDIKNYEPLKILKSNLFKKEKTGRTGKVRGAAL